MQSRHFQDYSSLTPICTELFSESDEQFFNSKSGKEQLPYLQRFELQKRDSGYRLYQLFPQPTQREHYEEGLACSAKNILS